ncbi:hypothetical protein C7271_24485, partial [filamentous cyanobacterium CCP5]
MDLSILFAAEQYRRRQHQQLIDTWLAAQAYAEFIEDHAVLSVGSRYLIVDWQHPDCEAVFELLVGEFDPVPD